MARLLIRTAANDHPTDAALTPLRTRPGDVVEIKPDGWEWRSGELNSGQYRVIDVPGVAEGDLVHLKTEVYAADEVTIIRRRNQCLDIAALAAGPWRTRTSATRNQLAAITITRA